MVAKGQRQSEEQSKKHSETMRAIWASKSEEEKQKDRERKSESHRKRWAATSNEEKKERGRQSVAGWGPEARQRLSESTRRRNLEWAAEGRHPFQSQENKDKTGQIAVDFWENASEEKKIERLESMHLNKGSSVEKTFPERMLEIKLEELFPGEWRYNDKWFMLSGKIPDFVNVNGQKKLIEVFGPQCHEPEEEITRPILFKESGYKTLILWSYEVVEKGIDDRLREFHYSGQSFIFWRKFVSSCKRFSKGAVRL